MLVVTTSCLLLRASTSARTVKPGGARLVAESPSPMPPPRSRARASLDNNNGDASSAAAVAAATETAAVRALAGGIFGVVVLLASEWVEVGSGLAEISMRADTWGNRLLASLLQVGTVRCNGSAESRRGRGGVAYSCKCMP